MPHIGLILLDLKRNFLTIVGVDDIPERARVPPVRDKFIRSKSKPCSGYLNRNNRGQQSNQTDFRDKSGHEALGHFLWRVWQAPAETRSRLPN